MNTRQYLQLESIAECAAIAGEKEFRLPHLNVLRKQLEEALAEVRSLSATQVAGNLQTKADSLVLTATRAEVRKRMFRISRQGLATLRGIPGIKEDLKVPHKNAKDADTIRAASRIVKNLRPHMKALHAAGLPKEAIPRLEESVRKLKAQSAGSAGLAKRTRATASIPDAIRSAREIAKALDAAIRDDISDERALVRWSSVYRIPRKKGRPKKRPAAAPVS